VSRSSTSLAFERFRALVDQDDELASALWPEMPFETFVTLVVRLAAERSLTVDPEDVRAAMADGSRRWFSRAIV
jgi:hypothetical protein